MLSKHFLISLMMYFNGVSSYEYPDQNSDGSSEHDHHYGKRHDLISDSPDLMDHLIRQGEIHHELKRKHEKGEITEEEFHAKQAELMDENEKMMEHHENMKSPSEDGELWN